MDVLLGEDGGYVRGGNVGLESEDCAGGGDGEEGVGEDLEVRGGEGVNEGCVESFSGFSHGGL